MLLPLLADSDPPYRARVMLFGGGGVPPSTQMPATDTCEILDFGLEPLAWRSAPPLSRPRVMADSVLLPDGTVLVCGGSAAGWSHDANQPVYETEIYNPLTNSWSPMTHTRVPRLYHATALLLPDGRVVTAGTDEAYNIHPFKHSELRLEVFSPPYLFRGPRPAITGAPDNITYGATFSVGTPQPQSIASAALMRPGAVTHSLGMEQRYVGLRILARTEGLVQLQAPPDGNIAPPGYYMLFLLNQNGVPSQARFVRLMS